MPKDQTRAVLRHGLRNLADEVRRERAVTRPGSADHDFYLGVDAAIQQWLHPELAATSTPERLGRESAAFRRGFTKTSAMIGSAASDPPVRLSLPSPDRPLEPPGAS